LVASVSRQF